MICRLCLRDAATVFNIFTDKGVQLQVAETVAKYFWFLPKPDDPISTVICDACWIKVEDFDNFYKIVEEAHRLLTERFSLKVDKKQKRNENVVFENEFETRLEAETTASGDENYETLFNEVLDDRNSDTLVKMDIPFVDENEMMTEFLSLDEHDRSEESSRISAVNDEANKSRRITRSESKRSQTLLNPPTSRICKSVKTENSQRKKPLISSESSASKVCSKEEKSQRNSGKQRCKYRNIDEQIAKYLCLQCDICGVKETSFIGLSKHMNTLHNIRGYVNCCNKKFYRRSLLFHHIEKHLDPDCLKCQECDKTFADKQCLRNHMLIKHQPDEAKIFACKFCEKKFAKSYLLDQHQRLHDERIHKCEICQKGFATANLLNAHVKVIHNNYGTMCEICAKVIRGRSAFARHVLEHQGVTLPKVQCPKCAAWYKDKHSLQKHIRRHNEDGTVHICPECGKVAPNRSALLAHKRYVHKERLFECGICKKAFKKQIGLKEHMAQHTGETLYNCPYCPRTFNSNANMHSHRKKMHPKEFAEARLKRHETKIMHPKDETTDNRLEQNEQVTAVNEHLMLTSDDETQILISTEKLNELLEVEYT